MKPVYISSFARTPVGGFGGQLSSFSATELGTHAISAVVERSGVDPQLIEAVYMGNVLSANLGQSPARQAALHAGLPVSADATTINKVCASGLKAVAAAAGDVMLGKAQLAVAGGMESMSNAPFYAPFNRFGHKTGNLEMIDGMIRDGLWDPYSKQHMGTITERAVRKYGISREEQDAYAARSYRLALASIETGKFDAEISALTMAGKKGTQLLDKDEDAFKVNYEKMPLLKPTFVEDGTITAANASNLNDGAAAMLVTSDPAAFGVKPVARIVDFADAATEPDMFSVAPSLAIRKLLDRNDLSIADIDYFEINEAYAFVPLVNSRLLQLPLEKINVLGGAVALGHPIGASGARILTTLLNVLIRNDGRLGIAAICNGGGGATAMLIEKV
jgi:acetyl-CoA C-acetyltransferase